MYSNTLSLADVEVGKHFYWYLNNELTVHGQVLIVSWFVLVLVISFSLLGTQNVERIPKGWQNFMEFVVEFIEDIAKNN